MNDYPLNESQILGNILGTITVNLYAFDVAIFKFVFFKCVGESYSKTENKNQLKQQDGRFSWQLIKKQAFGYVNTELAKRWISCYLSTKLQVPKDQPGETNRRCAWLLWIRSHAVWILFVNAPKDARSFCWDFVDKTEGWQHFTCLIFKTSTFNFAL